jgi:hypothetical protein
MTLMDEGPPGVVSDVFRDAGPAASQAVQQFLREAPAKGLTPDTFGYILFQEPGNRMSTIRLDTSGFIHFDGDAAASDRQFARGLPFCVQNGRILRGPFPPPDVVGVDAAAEAARHGFELLVRLLDDYAATGTTKTSM